MEGGRESSPFSSQWQKVPSFPSSSPSSSSSSGIRPWVLVLLASIFVVLFIPSFLSSNFRGFRPSLVKNGWDTLNLALVVFAILCGLLGRDAASGGGGSGEESEKMTALQPHPPVRSQEWDAYSPAPELDVYEEENRTRGIQRMRSSSSYPDLRQEFHAGDGWGVTAGWRFADDIEIYRRRRLGSLDETTVKSIQVNTVELPKSPMWSRSPLKTPPPSSPPVPVTLTMTAKRPPPTPPPPPPPPPPLFPKQKIKSHRKRKDIATAIALFYNKKNRRSKTKKISNDESPPAAYPSPLHAPPPAPPPPPPPSSVFSQIFTYKKGGNKMKMSHSIPVHRSSPPPPPPPPPNFRHWKEKEVPIQQPPPPPPPPPPSTPPRVPRKKRVTRPSYLNTYPIAPPSPLPPPPPPPPGDDNAAYAKIAGEGTAPPFCPSPDVNNKADMFIKRFRAGLKMEKLNSIREKDRRQQKPPQERLQGAGIEVEMDREIMAMMMEQGGLSEE